MLQRLTGSIPDMSSLRQLLALQLHNNRLTGELPFMPATMRNLHLEHNSLRCTAWSESVFLRTPDHYALTACCDAG